MLQDNVILNMRLIAEIYYRLHHHEDKSYSPALYCLTSFLIEAGFDRIKITGYLFGGRKPNNSSIFNLIEFLEASGISVDREILMYVVRGNPITFRSKIGKIFDNIQIQYSSEDFLDLPNGINRQKLEEAFRELQCVVWKAKPKMQRIFLAHANEDKPLVRQLYAQLKAKGFSPWLDAEDLIPGQNWRAEIPKAIQQARICLACLSKLSIAKQGYVQREFRYALSAFAERPPGSIYLIPVRLDDCELPDLQLVELELKFTDLHWVDLFADDGFEKLVSAIEKEVFEVR